MRLINLKGRMHLVVGEGAVDIAEAGEGHFGSTLSELLGQWDAVVQWASTVSQDAGSPYHPADLDSPVTAPPQVFAVGLNYSEHAAESGLAKPEYPVVFTKFPTSIAGAVTTVVMPTETVDWEVELVVVIGRGGRNISEEDAWAHVAGLSVGQDISERESQRRGPAAQFSLAKSFANFSPIGPALVTADELEDPNALDIGCAINGEEVQHGSTTQMIFPVAELIASISAVVELLAGDVIFTGTPSGVGAGRKPPRYLKPGDVLRSWIGGIGEIEQTFTASA